MEEALDPEVKRRIRGHNCLNWALTIVIVSLLVVGLRCYIVESYCISTPAMQDALQIGDRVLVDKWKRQWMPARNNVVLFSSPLRKDADHHALFLGRCIGMPGDTILINDEGYRINGQQHPLPPQALRTYQITNEAATSFIKCMDTLHIRARNQQQVDGGLQFSLTPFEAYLLREEMDEQTKAHFTRVPIQPYTIIVPRKGVTYPVNEAMLTAYQEAILCEQGNRMTIQDGHLFHNGKEIKEISFKRNYYWILADNAEEAIDSRHLGIVPYDRIVGVARFCWFSTDLQRIWKSID